MKNFNYESKLWGASKVSLSLFDLNSLKLKYTLEDSKDVGGSVLDIGCGGGGMAAGLKDYRPDLNVAGIDISKKALAQAKRNFRNVDFVYGDILKLSKYTEKKFDAIIMYDVLEHVAEPTKLLGEIHRSLKKEGVFCFFVPLDGSLFTIHGWLKLLGFTPKLRYAGHVQQFSEPEIVNLLKTSGFSVQKKRYSQYFLSQIVDIAYFAYLALRGKNVPYSVETFVSQGGGLPRLIINFLKSTFALFSNGESLIFRPFPGLGLQIKAVKRG